MRTLGPGGTLGWDMRTWDLGRGRAGTAAHGSLAAPASLRLLSPGSTLRLARAALDAPAAWGQSGSPVAELLCSPSLCWGSPGALGSGYMVWVQDQCTPGLHRSGREGPAGRGCGQEHPASPGTAGRAALHHRSSPLPGATSPALPAGRCRSAPTRPTGSSCVPSTTLP